MNFSNPSKNFEALHIPSKIGNSKYKHFNTIMSCFTLTCSTTNILLLLKTLFSLELFKLVHSLADIKIVESDILPSGPSLPILEMERGGKKPFHIASQLKTDEK